MRRVLLIADLEGVAGVDDPDLLTVAAAGHHRACELYTAEIRAAADGFRQAGFDHVLVSDSHRAGSRRPNAIAAELPSFVTVDYRDDAYDDALFAGAQVVACLGMHAAAGTNGFAAHTVGLTAAWIEHGSGRALSESDLVLGLAAEHGLPVAFVSGDDVLERTLAGRVPYVRTKTASSPRAATSFAVEDVHARLRAAAAGPAVPAPAIAPGDWELRFKQRRDPAAITGATTRDRYQRARELQRPVDEILVRALRLHDQKGFVDDVTCALVRGWDREPPADTTDAARRALAAFLRATDGDAAWQLADRALILHMLSAHAPTFFAAADLAPVLDAAVERCAALPDETPPDLPPNEAMWRVDAAYVRAARGLPHGRFPGLDAYVRSVERREPVMAWITYQMGVQLGACPAFPFPERPLRPHSRWHDLYWLTHLFLLATRFLHAPLDRARFASEIEELTLAVPWVLEQRTLDLACELAICMQLAGEEDSGAHRTLLEAVVAGLDADGRLADPIAGAAVDGEAHGAGVALLALGRYAKRT